MTEVLEVSKRDRYCPCCGHTKLAVAPYKNYKGPPIPQEAKPPYRLFLGEPSYEVCSCCGYEFGNDDEPGTSEPISFKDYLLCWVENGCVWFEPGAKPQTWSVGEQLRNAGM